MGSCTPTDSSYTPPPCPVTVAPGAPTPSDGIFYRAPLKVAFSSFAPEPVLTLLPPDGVPVQGSTTVSADHQRAVFTPDIPLIPQANHALTVDVGLPFCDPTILRYTTSAAGTSPSPPGEVPAQVYAIDLTQGQVVSDDGTYRSFPTYILSSDDAPRLLLSATTLDTSRGTADLQVAMGRLDADTVVQDPCSPAVSFSEPADAEAFPFPSQVSALPVELGPHDGTLHFEQLAVSGTFLPDASSLQGIDLTGVLDTRTIPSSVLDGFPNFCELLSALTPCVPCEDGEAACVAFHLTELSAPNIGSDGLCEGHLEGSDDVCQDASPPPP